MRKILFLMLLLPFGGFAQMPLYTDVLKQFFELYTYQAPSDDIAEGLNFAKKKDGWHVQLVNRVNEQVKTDKLFWSAAGKKYLALNFPLAGDTDFEKRIGEYFNTSPLYQFYGYMRCTYYGYSHWAEDMIAEFGTDPNPSYPDSVIEGLGRANGVMASKFLWYQYGGAGEDPDTLKRKLGPLELPSRQRIDSVDYYNKKAIEQFTLLTAKNPAYQTIVGSVGSKLFNDQFNSFMQLTTAGYPDLAKEYLQSIKPNQALRRQARNFLAACPPNTILFTYGDNDTYPLLYIQQIEQYRKDVSVVNNSLIGLPIFVDQLKKTSLKFSSTRNTYGDNSFSYYSYDDQLSKKKTWTLPELIDIIQKKKHPGSVAYGTNDTIFNYPATQLTIPVNLEKFRKLTSQPNLVSKISIPLNTYLLSNEFIMLDIINSNIHQRPIYFTATEQLFNGWLQKEGLIYRLLPLDAAKTKQNEEISMQKTIAYLNKYFQFNPTNDLSSGMGLSSNFDGAVYELFADLAKWYLDKHKPSEAKFWLNKLEAGYKGNYPFDFNLSSPAFAMLQAGDKKGLSLLETYVKTLYGFYLHPQADMGYMRKEFILPYIDNVIHMLKSMQMESEVVNEVRAKFD